MKGGDAPRQRRHGGRDDALLYVCASRAAGHRAGVLAGLFWSLTLPAVFYAKTANLDVPYTFWFALALLLYTRALDDASTSGCTPASPSPARWPSSPKTRRTAVRAAGAAPGGRTRPSPGGRFASACRRSTRDPAILLPS
jgi:hypothetical protein